MKLKTIVFAASLIVVGFSYNSCTKNSNPTPPVHDTVTVHKTDTLLIQQKIDTPDMKTGLVLYLPLNGNFGDSSGKGNTVAAVGGATLDYDLHGYAQSAFNGNGSGGRLIVSNNGAYKVDTAFSVSFDFMIRNSSGTVIFLSIVDTAQGNGPTFNCGLNIPALPFNFGFGNNTSLSTCGESGIAHRASDTWDTTNFVPQPGSWYNIVCTYTKGVSSVYVNGKLSKTSTGTSTSSLFCPNANFVVGGWWNGDPLSINGKLDEVRMYNRTLNAQQIAWLSRNFQPGSTKVHANVESR